MVDAEDARKSKQLLDAMNPIRCPQMVYYESYEFADILVGTLKYAKEKCGYEMKD